MDVLGDPVQKYRNHSGRVGRRDRLRVREAVNSDVRRTV